MFATRPETGIEPHSVRTIKTRKKIQNEGKNTDLQRYANNLAMTNEKRKKSSCDYLSRFWEEEIPIGGSSGAPSSARGGKNCIQNPKSVGILQTLATKEVVGEGKIHQSENGNVGRRT